MNRTALLPAVILLCRLAPASAPTPLDSGLRPQDVEQRRYRQYARQCIDLLIEHGTDRYGTVRSPMLMSILDVRTRQCPADPPALDQQWRVIRRGRRNPGGGNLYMDQPTLRAMGILSEMTGETRYRDFVRRSAAWTLKNLADEKGFLWWGWHRHYDAHRDKKTGHSGNPHEIHVQQIAWPLLWDVDREAAVREIEAIWQWHVIDKETGEVNRHGDGRRGCDFAMSGGEILRAFAFLHSETGEKLWHDRARLVADDYWKARHQDTKLIPNRPNAGKKRFDGSHFDTSIIGLHCPALLDAWQWTKDRRFRHYAVAYLKAYARLGYDAEAEQFWGSLTLDGQPNRGPRVPSGYAGYEPRGHIDLWEPYVAGYEMPIYAAQAYAYAYDLTREPELLDAARRWADCIRRAWPPRECSPNAWYRDYSRHWAPHGTYAGLYGRTLSFLLHLHALTEDAEYLDLARDVAKESVSKLLYRGLFRGHPAKPTYEATDGVGYLLVALLQLDAALDHGKGARSTCKNW
jgi:hypothetical protein